jgi:cyanophycin synthetase
VKIESIKIIDGKNRWSESRKKLVHIVLDLGKYEELPSNKIPGFYERLKKYIPTLQKHRCSVGRAGGFFKRVKEGTWMGHIIEHIALELQTLAEMETGWGRTRGVKGKIGIYNVVFEYVDADCGKTAANEAIRVVKEIIADRDPKIDGIVSKLKKMKKKRLDEGFGAISMEPDTAKRILEPDTSRASAMMFYSGSSGTVPTHWNNSPFLAGRSGGSAFGSNPRADKKTRVMSYQEFVEAHKKFTNK